MGSGSRGIRSHDTNEISCAHFHFRTGKRDEIFFATKFANGATDRNGTTVIDSSFEYCKKACAKSLERLGIECIDLYYMHRTDLKTPVEDTVRAMAELKR